MQTFTSTTVYRWQNGHRKRRNQYINQRTEQAPAVYCNSDESMEPSTIILHKLPQGENNKVHKWCRTALFLHPIEAIELLENNLASLLLLFVLLPRRRMDLFRHSYFLSHIKRSQTRSTDLMSCHVECYDGNIHQNRQRTQEHGREASRTVQFSARTL